MFCGTEAFPCPEGRCESEYERAMALDLPALYAALGITTVAAPAGCDEDVRELANAYFDHLHPDVRRSSLWDLPAWCTDVARIGDAVWAEKVRRMLES